MQTFIHTHGIDLTDSLKRQAHTQLDLALNRIEDEIVSISVHLIDTNGPFLNGVDKACRIAVQIRNQEPIIAEDIDENVSVVVDRVTERLGVVASQRADSYKRSKPYRGWIDEEQT